MTREERTMMFVSQVPALIGQQLRERNKLITQKEIAAATGLSRATVSKWVSEKADIGYLDPDTAFKLCEYFGCTLDELVKIEGKPK